MEWSYEVAITQLHPRSSFFRSSYANSTYKSIESISFDIALAIDTLELEARAMLIVKLSNRRVLLLWWYARVPREVHRPGSRAMLEGAAHSLFSPSSPSSSPFSHARFSARKQEKERGAEGDKSDEGQRGHGPTPDASVPPPSCPHLSSSPPAPACTAAAVGKEEFQASRRPRRTDRCVGRGPHPARPPLPPCVHPKRPSRTGKPNRTTHLRVGPRFTWPHMQ